MTFGLWSCNSSLPAAPPAPASELFLASLALPFPLPGPKFVVFAVTVSVPLVLAFAVFESEEAGLTGEIEALEFNDCTDPMLAFLVGCLCRNFGAGKLDFLSIASTVL
jgi:hypothetical protein